MRCIGCSRTFTHPSTETRESQKCSICRGTMKHLKMRQECESTSKIKQREMLAARHLHFGGAAA